MDGDITSHHRHAALYTYAVQYSTVGERTPSVKKANLRFTCQRLTVRFI
jgi:hypothetical protein